MTRQKENFPAWFLLLWEKGVLILLTVGIVFMLVVGGVGYFLNERLEDIEGSLSRGRPANYQPPDLDDYAAPPIAAEDIAREQALYVPVYSHVYYDRGRPYQLETTLSLRNRDGQHPIYVRSVRYYDTDGKLTRTLVDRLIKLDPFETLEHVIPERDTSGGSGANFVVEWLATAEVDDPLVEAIMVGAAGPQGITFRTEGTPIRGVGDRRTAD